MILDHAARLFRQRGYAETSVRDIATVCGMKTASLYYHFASKEEIVIEVLNTGVATVSEESRRRVDRLGPHAAPAERVQAAISAHLHALREQDDYTGANIRIFGHVPPHVRAATMHSREQYEQWRRDVLADAAARGAIRPDTDLAHLRLLLLGAMNWSVEWHKPRPGKCVGSIACSLTTLALRGVFVEGSEPQRRPRHTKIGKPKPWKPSPP
ncbi:TetR/AcrR family transcriptional regulator [Rhodopila sp.]|uniref:TetR/AcrR family transcriptional regulator n=1 Tax=Rhodopila sp. TaxID=2480087 RepID=UPI003D140FD3